MPTKMVDRKTIVLKSRYDPDMVKLLGEKLRSRLFARISLRKPKPEEVRLVSIEKFYEPRILIGGKYDIDYHKKCHCTIKVKGDPREVVFLDRKFVPETLSGTSPESGKVIKFDGVAYFHHGDQASCIIDNKGREVDPEEFPWAPSEEQHIETLKNTGMKFIEVKISPEEEIEFLRSRVAKRPSDVGEVTREAFEINERAVIYTPIYQLTFQNIKARKRAIVRIDGVTGKMISDRPAKKSSGKFKRDLIQANRKALPSTARRPKEAVQGLNKKDGETIQMSKVSKTERAQKFPARVVGDFFRVGDNVTAVVGDLEIPSGKTLYETLVVKGYLRIGRDCRIIGTAKALKGITIGVNTSVKGNVVSGGNVVIHPDCIIQGSVEAAGQVEVGENTVIEGRLYSKSSVKLNQFASVKLTVNAEEGITVS